MIASQRRLYIMNQLTQNSVINLKETAEALNASESTIRRDIDYLESEGKLKRVLGGAELTNLQKKGSDVAELTMTMRQKSNAHVEEKLLVARKAAEFVKDGDCVFVDGGTSSVFLIKMLIQKHIYLVTNNQLALQEIINPTATIVSVGGTYIPHFNMTAGILAENFLRDFHFDHAFITCSGVDLRNGMCYTSELDTIGIKSLATSHADHSYLLIDASKLSFKAFCKCMALEDFEHVICNDPCVEMKVPENFLLVNERK